MAALVVYYFCLFNGLLIHSVITIVLNDNIHVVQSDSRIHRYRSVQRPDRSNVLCQPVRNATLAHELVSASNASNASTVHTRYFRHNVGPDAARFIYGHLNVINDPVRTVTVLEPGGQGGCTNRSRTKVSDTARFGNCILSTNAGFFNTKTGACIGNVISDGRVVSISGGIQNAHFGTTADGYLFFGYLSEADLSKYKFVNLVAGVIWIIRNGTSYVEQAVNVECAESQETGTLAEFATVISARTAVGHDKDGRLIMVHVDGKTRVAGVSLYEFADFLISLGVQNAINLDGGGSSTMVLNGTVINYPSDLCNWPDVSQPWVCERAVTSVLCVHPPPCAPGDCHQPRTQHERQRCLCVNEVDSAGNKTGSMALSKLSRGTADANTSPSSQPAHLDPSWIGVLLGISAVSFVSIVLNFLLMLKYCGNETYIPPRTGSTKYTFGSPDQKVNDGSDDDDEVEVFSMERIHTEQPVT